MSIIFEKFSAGFVFAATLTCLVLAACWPAFGPAWHVDTGVGQFMMSSNGRIGLFIMASLAVLGVFSALRRRSLPHVLGLLCLSLAPLTLVLLPVPMISLEDRVLRHHDPETYVREHRVPIEVPDSALAVPPVLVWLFSGGEDWIGIARLNALSDILRNRDTTIGTEGLSTLEGTLAANSNQLKVVDFGSCFIFQGIRDLSQSGPRREPPWDGEPVENKACMERMNANHAHNDPIRKEIARLEGEIELAKAALLSDDQAAARLVNIEALLTGLQARANVHIWSSAGATFAAIFLAISVLFLGLGWAGLSVFPVATGAMMLGSHPNFFDLSMPALAPDLFVWASMASLLSVLLALTACRHFWTDNRAFIRQARMGPLLRSVGRAAVFWLPLGILLIGATILSQKGNTAIQNIAYNLKIEDEIAEQLAADPDACIEDLHLISEQEPDCVRRPETDIEASIAHWFVEAQQAMYREVDTMQVASDAGVGSASAAILASFDRVIPDYLRTEDISPPPPASTGVSAAFNHRDCRWYQVPCRFVRAAKYGANRAYVTRREEYRGRLEVKLFEIAEQVGATSADVADATRGFIPQTMSELEAVVVGQIWAFFRLGDVLAAIGQAVAVLAIVKSFGFLLARSVLARQDELPGLTLGCAPNSIEQNANIPHVRLGNQDGLRLIEEGRYQVVLGTHVDGASPKGLVLFQPLSQLGKRIFPLRHLFQYFDVNATKPVSIPSGHVRRIIEVKLDPGQRIGFFPRFLLGVSGHPQLTSRWTFDLAFFLTGRCRHCFAEGPGTLYFSSTDTPSILKPGDGKGSVNPARLMAWSDGVVFEGEADINFLSLYTSAAHLHPSSSGIAIFDGPTGRNRIGGAIGFVPLLLTPL